uniref:Uncharacterized protein n=1 Tax=Photinus pyralis TaxID=7054 RepID=A0A1Y1MM64_PHOPY
MFIVAKPCLIVQFFLTQLVISSLIVLLSQMHVWSASLQGEWDTVANRQFIAHSGMSPIAASDEFVSAERESWTKASPANTRDTATILPLESVPLSMSKPNCDDVKGAGREEDGFGS